MSNVVSLHPYFRVQAGKLEEFRALCERFVERTSSEEACLFYGFSFNGDEVFCREAYAGGEGVLAHLANVGDLLGEGLKIAELTRVEIHGPADELAKLREPLAELGAAWFTYEYDLVK
jgi:hypothetical protein